MRPQTAIIPKSEVQSMEQAKNILNASLLWRWLMSLCRWCGDQWRASGVVQWFLHPGGWTPAASEHSVFYKLWYR